MSITLPASSSPRNNKEETKMKKKIIDVEIFDRNDTVNGFTVKPGFIRFVTDAGEVFFSSGWRVGKDYALFAYRLIDGKWEGEWVFSEDFVPGEMKDLNLYRVLWCRNHNRPLNITDYEDFAEFFDLSDDEVEETECSEVADGSDSWEDFMASQPEADGDYTGYDPVEERIDVLVRAVNSFEWAWTDVPTQEFLRQKPQEEQLHLLDFFKNVGKRWKFCGELSDDNFNYYVRRHKKEEKGE